MIPEDSAQITAFSILIISDQKAIPFDHKTPPNSIKRTFLTDN